MKQPQKNPAGYAGFFCSIKSGRSPGCSRASEHKAYAEANGTHIEADAMVLYPLAGISKFEFHFLVPYAYRRPPVEASEAAYSFGCSDSVAEVERYEGSYVFINGEMPLEVECNGDDELAAFSKVVVDIEAKSHAGREMIADSYTLDCFEVHTSGSVIAYANRVSKFDFGLVADFFLCLSEHCAKGKHY